MKVRIKFTKQGVIKYIGHLDLMRYFQKAFRRTDINVLYSKGFSPHMIMSFAAPLGVGLESIGEYFDIEVADSEDISLFPDKLNEQMAEGITVLKAVKLPDDQMNAMASVRAADYELHFDKETPLDKGLIDFYGSHEEIIYVKTTKSGEHPINIKEFVFDLSEKAPDILYIRTDASSSGNLKPRTALEAILSAMGLNIEDYPFHTFRLDLFMENESGELVTLGDV